MIPMDRLPRLLPIVYLIWAVPLLITLCWLIPPWQTPDEPAHLMRADQVGHGEIIGSRRTPRLAGGVTDPDIVASAHGLNTVAGHSDARVGTALLAQAGSLAWGARRFQANPNTAQYAPFLYLPQAVAVRIGQAAHLSVVLTLRLARLAAGIAASLICAAGFGCARRTAPLLLIVVMLPMNLFLFASASQDGLMLACMVLAVGLLDRVIDAGRDATRGERTAVIVLLTLVVMARPPYAPLALLGLLLTRRLGWAAAAAAVIPLGCALAWTEAAAWHVTIPMNGADLGGQLRFCLAHPGAVWTALQMTWTSSSDELWLEVVGRLGWLDTELPSWFATLAELLLAAGLLSTLGGSSRRAPVAWLAVLFALAGVVLAQYLTWTPVGADTVQGLQGRYAEVLLAVCALSLPGMPILTPATRPAGLTAAAVMAMATPLVILKAIVWRYYLQ